MKSGRRIDADNLRRDSRDREVAHTSGNTRFGRKRPSMLSEFHGNKHYNAREGERDSLQHYRSHSRYLHDTSGGGVALPDHTHASFMSSGSHSKSKPDSRSRYTHHHSQNRPITTATAHHHSNSYHHANSSDTTPEEENPIKRPRLMSDASRKFSDTTPGSADSVGNSVLSNSGLDGGSPTDISPWPSGAGGLLPYHLEDIDSDDDSLLQEEYDKKLSKSPTPVPVDSPAPSSPSSPPASSSPLKEQPPKGRSEGGSPMPSKEELLMMMEKVDRGIAAAETQISPLEKKRVELEETARTATSPHSSALSSPTTPPEDQTSSSALMTSMTEEDSPLPSPSPPGHHSPKRSVMDIIYSDNRIKSKSAHASLFSIGFSLLPGTGALYHQPCEAPLYCHNLLSHQEFRPKLIQYLRKRKLEKHKKDLQLCEEYDSLMGKWERSVEHIDMNPKKRLRDQKNREMFEKHFPELKLKREHHERMTRVDQRGYPIVRSDAELKEIMYELCEQEAEPVRNRKTHAVIPPMLTDERDRRVRFLSRNGLISDPMALHRDSRFINAWSEEEKGIFRDKYVFYPKNFEVIASFLPNKTPADCIQYYYLTKKRENFKHLVRKANLKRKKPFVKPLDYSNSPLSPSSIPSLPLSMFASAKPKIEDAMSADEDSTSFPPEFGDWLEEEISCLKEGLRKYGRAWGKIYREVGRLKTATQCKKFYDEHCTNKQLELSVALAEHSSMKNAEKMRRKESQSRKPLATVMVEGKRKAQKPPSKPSPHQEPEEIDSENTASAYETDSNSDDSTSESTITDSSHEDGSSNSAFMQPVQPTKLVRGKKPKSLSAAGFRRTSEEALDLFISAAEALNNIIPPEVALHDHTYAQPPSSIINNVELQGTSGLSLIAAAAAVVSPTLSKSAASTKLPSLSPVRAPRGRPPNSQRKGTNGTTSKLAPTLLSPAGTSPSVLLTEMKAAPLRGRARSAPSDRPKVSTLHVSRASSTLARMSINSSSRTMNRGGGGTGSMASSSYSRHKGESSAGKSTSSLKSMIACHPPSSCGTPSSTSSTTNSTATGANSTSAFEALVNVAVAAPPAELPRSATSPHTNSHTTKASSPGTTAAAFTATPLSRSHSSSKETAVTIGVAGSNSNASNSTTTAYIDVNQAINILASLAQQQVSSSTAAANGGSSQSLVLPNSRLFTQNSMTLLGNIVSQGTKSGAAGLMSAALPTPPKGAKGLSVSATVDTLLGHLTSGMGAQAASSKTAASRTVGGGKTKGAKFDTPGAKVAVNNKGSKNQTLAAAVPQSIQLMGNMDDLSNLNLLSSLVAAVTATQSTAAPTTSQQTTPSFTLTSNLKTSVGQPSNLHGGSKTEMKRPLESIVSALVRNSSSSSLTDSTSSSHVSSQAHTPTPLDDCNGGGGKAQEGVDKLIAASSSIKKANSSSVYGATSLATSELPRSVVRTGLGTMSTGESLANQGDNSVAPSESDMTASLASIIPPYNPSCMSSQASLLLYTRSLLSVTPEPSTEEEDHLESATRGISELSKLLGTDSNAENSSSLSTKHDNTIYKGLSNWNPAELLSSPLSKNACSDFAGELAEKPGKPYLSSLLESQVHGTVHHTAPQLNTNSGVRTENSIEATLDVDHSRCYQLEPEETQLTMWNMSLDIGGELETFLYTPYGVSTLVGVVILLTSLLWCLGCCVYCCIQRRHSLNQEGVLEANREMDYYGVLQSGLSNGEGGGGEETLSSGYNTAPIPHSLNSITGTTHSTTLTTSLDSIIDREA